MGGLLASALLTTAPVYAQLPTDDCPTMGQLAATIATGRDQGIPQATIEQVLLLGLESLPQDDPQRPAMLRLVAYIYERPHLSPPQSQSVITEACTNKATKPRR
jgi:hypothetical protein